MVSHNTALKNKMNDLAEMYFDDMRLAKGSVVEKFFWVTVGDLKDDDWAIENQHEIEAGEIEGWKIENGEVWRYESPDDITRDLDVDSFCHVVDELEDGTCAAVNNETHTVTVAPEYVNDDVVLLHELIHVFEWFYRQENEPYKNQRGKMVAPCVPSFLRDALFISLYNHVKKEMKKKYPDENLDSRILNHAHFLPGELITAAGGHHDILFFLKSLDLDLRLDLPLGTVCGYSRDKCNKDDADATVAST